MPTSAPAENELAAWPTVEQKSSAVARCVHSINFMQLVFMVRFFLLVSVMA